MRGVLGLLNFSFWFLVSLGQKWTREWMDGWMDGMDDDDGLCIF